MANLTPDPVWEDVYQIEPTDRVLGGPGGISNLQAQSLVNQNLYARKHGGALPYLPSLAYDIGDRVKLTNGDIVCSTIANNTNNPNSDMTGWVKVNSASQIFDESGLTQQEINNGVNSIADLVNISNPFDGQRVFVKSYNAPLYILLKPYQGGNVFIYDAAKSHINDGVFVINGWVAQNQNLTFEKCGVVVGLPQDQSAAINKAIRYAISSRIYHLTFETQGRVYIADTVEIPPVKLDEGGKYTYVYTTQLTLDTAKVTFESIASTNIEMFRVLRPKTKFTSLVINNDTYKRTGTGLRIGLTRADADRYPRTEYYTNDTGEFDLI
ncbi:putative tail fiber protein [Acinetobacter phage Scuro]|nr:putative tail fiber protein [Acinetobacter phage Scuro]